MSRHLILVRKPFFTKVTGNRLVLKLCFQHLLIAFFVMSLHVTFEIRWACPPKATIVTTVSGLLGVVSDLVLPESASICRGIVTLVTPVLLLFQVDPVDVHLQSILLSESLPTVVAFERKCSVMNDLHMSTEIFRTDKLHATLSAFELLLRLADDLVVPLHGRLLGELLLTTRAGILYSLVLGFDVFGQSAISFVGFATVRAGERSVSGVNKLVLL